MSWRFLSGVTSLVSLAWALTPAHAAEISSHTTEAGTNLVFVIGDIEQGDVAKFKNEASKFSDATVLLESDGGSTAAAIEIGEAIRLKGYSTSVVNDSRCNSACALIWLAGTPRILARSARVGFHASYTDSGGKRSESGVGNAFVGRYLTLLNLPERALLYATSAPPSSLNWVDASNYRSVGIDLTLIDDLKLDNDKSSSEVSERTKETTEWDRTGFWTTMIDHTLGDSCFLMAGFTEGTKFRIGFNGADGSYLMILNSAWASLREGQQFKLSVEFDSEGAWDVPVEVVMMSKSPTLLAKFSDNRFWGEFIKANTVQIDRQSKRVTRLNLAGSAAAFKSLVACQRANAGGQTQKDPFQD